MNTYTACPLDPSKPVGRRRHEDFARRLAWGWRPTAAYRAAFPRSARWRDDALCDKAARLASKVRLRVAWLREFAPAGAAPSFCERQRILSQIARGSMPGHVQSDDGRGHGSPCCPRVAAVVVLDPVAAIRELNSMFKTRRATGTDKEGQHDGQH